MKYYWSGMGLVQRTMLPRADTGVHSLLLQHPDYELMEEAYSEVVRRFHAKMDHTEPIIAYVNKGIALEVPKRGVVQCITTEEDENA